MNIKINKSKIKHIKPGDENYPEKSGQFVIFSTLVLTLLIFVV